ncbi:MAG: helix-turn-helix domain-containing protein [Ruminococcaceae bacterium]|nr:helix-turn-helix domain-containing protein [Oscillospiraceae bacterium]
MEIVQEIRRNEIICHTRKYKTAQSNFHWHENYEICQVLNKPCNFRVDGQLIEANVGDIIAINEHTIHQFLVLNDETDIRIFQFPLKILMNFNSVIEPLKVHITHEEIFAIPELEEKLDILFDMMEKEGKAIKAFENPFLQSIAASVYLLLERHFSVSQSVFAKNKDRQMFYKIVEYINEHFKEEISVSSISNELYLSRGRLADVFKKYSGVSITEYINSLRINNANYMLMHGSTATEAALESGFASVRTFNNVYKSVMNMTPSEYVKKERIIKKEKV